MKKVMISLLIYKILYKTKFDMSLGVDTSLLLTRAQKQLDLLREYDEARLYELFNNLGFFLKTKPKLKHQ